MSTIFSIEKVVGKSDPENEKKRIFSTMKWGLRADRITCTQALRMFFGNYKGASRLGNIPYSTHVRDRTDLILHQLDPMLLIENMQERHNAL